MLNQRILLWLYEEPLLLIILLTCFTNKLYIAKRIREWFCIIIIYNKYCVAVICLNMTARSIQFQGQRIDISILHGYITLCWHWMCARYQTDQPDTIIFAVLELDDNALCQCIIHLTEMSNIRKTYLFYYCIYMLLVNLCGFV